MRRLLCVVLVAATALTLSAGPARAEDVSAGPFDPTTIISLLPGDGGVCTGVPDAIPGLFDFTDACAAHDACYAAGEQTQAECDEAFLENLTAACVVQHPSTLDARRYACLALAQLYYFGVRLFGQFFI